MRWVIGLVAVLALGQLALADGTGAAFHDTAANPGSRLGADTLDPPSAFSASRSCALTVPTFRAATTNASDGTASFTLAKPAGVVSGDLLLAVLIHVDQSNPPGLPSGWTALRRGTANSQSVLAWKLAGGSEPSSYVFSVDASDVTSGAMVAYSGVNQSSPIGAHGMNEYGASSTFTAPSATSTDASTRLVVGYAVDNYASTVSVPATTTSRAFVNGSGGGQPATIRIVDREHASVGASGTSAATLTSGKDGAAFSVLVRSGAPNPVTLTWTATSDTYATGYAWTRTGSGATTTVSGRTTTTGSDATLALTSSATYSLRASFLTWRSVAATSTVPAC